MENLEIKIEKLEKENDKLKDSLLDLTTQLNYSIEKELAELVRNLYSGVKEELKNKESKLSKTEILENIKKNLEIFAKEYKFKL